jgi:hypothetical protein
VYVALLGLLIVATSLVPSALDRRRLERYHQRLAEETVRQERLAKALEKRLVLIQQDRFLRNRELWNLLHPR